ncbi:MAG: spore coat protein [Longicatena sp.]
MNTNKSTYSDKDKATNLLISLKHLKSEANTFTQEASNESLYKEAFCYYKTISTLQRVVFEMMEAQSWYKMSSDTQKNITKALNKYTASQSELS